MCFRSTNELAKKSGKVKISIKNLNIPMLFALLTVCHCAINKNMDKNSLLLNFN